MKKQIDISPRPKQRHDADKWVETQSSTGEPKVRVKPKRITIDIDPKLHSRLKIYTARQDIWISDLVRDLITRELENAAVD